MASPEEGSDGGGRLGSEESARQGGDLRLIAAKVRLDDPALGQGTTRFVQVRCA